MGHEVCLSECQIPERHSSGHKGTFGRVLLVAGSDGMSGAACLAGKAALRGGAGLVTVMVPESVLAIVAGYEPGYMTVGYVACEPTIADRLLESDGTVVDVLKATAEGKNVVAIGPGLGQSDVAKQLVRAVVDESPCPVILDADALNICAATGLLNNTDPKAGVLRDVIVTPHPGEFARLTGLSVSEVEANRVEAASAFAKQHQVIVVLKGPQTIVADGQKLYVNDSGNSGMATGGSGDVLTGLMAAVVAQGATLFDSACLSVWLHGTAGDSAAEAFSREAMIASDLAQHFGRAWRKLRSLSG